MFSRMPIDDIAKNRARYQVIITKTLAGLPKGITTKEVIEGYYLTFQVLFLKDETPFYISSDGGIFYYEKDGARLQRVSKADLVTEYEKRSRFEDE